MESSKWVSLLRSVMRFFIIIGIIGSVGGCVVMFFVFEHEEELAFLFGGGILVVGILITFISVSAIMIFLDMADDIRAIRQKLDKM